ncbi:MAG: hypothetical protein KatS3mg100_044 [Candidatus Parcubacteria bacterium]|nr:MAG: hypothetical protein KatS3mg100_044 [Candidatus Parcubacteria bacterium]
MTVFIDPAMAKRWSWREKLLFAMGVVTLVVHLAQVVAALYKTKTENTFEAATSSTSSLSAAERG